MNSFLLAYTSLIVLLIKKSNLRKYNIYYINKRKPIPFSNYLYLVYKYILKTRVRLIPIISVVRSQNYSWIR
jgi:hypothetical protein